MGGGRRALKHAQVVPGGGARSAFGFGLVEVEVVGGARERREEGGRGMGRDGGRRVEGGRALKHAQVVPGGGAIEVEVRVLVGKRGRGEGRGEGEARALKHAQVVPLGGMSEMEVRALVGRGEGGREGGRPL